jgi:RNA polymerase sigma-70 factor (ECF subfamily)
MDSQVPPDFNAFYAQHTPQLRRVLKRSGVSDDDLDDVLQEALVVIHRMLPDFEGRSSIETWLHAVAWRVSMGYHRRARSLPASLGLDALPLATPHAASASEGEVHAAWSALDADLRDLLALHEIGELSISQLSALTGLARATIRRRLQQRRRLHDSGERNAPGTPLGRALVEGFDGAPHLHVLPCGKTCLSSVDDLLIALWMGPADCDVLRTIAAAMQAMGDAFPQGFRYLSVISSASVPSREGRELNGEIARRFGDKLKAVSSAIEVPALRLLVAPVLNAYLVLARAPLNVRFFHDVRSAAAWLAGYGATPGERIEAHVTAMRARLRSHA